MRVDNLLLTLVLIASGACAAESSATTHSNSEHPVTADVEAFFAAMRAGDVAKLSRYLAEDYFLIGVGGNTRNKETRLAWLKDNISLLSTIRPSDLKVRHYGDAAVVTGLVTITDESPTVYERFTHVWARKGGSWQMVSGQVTAVAPEHQEELLHGK
jgi:ketosteroid isomerase-like protein